MYNESESLTMKRMMESIKKKNFLCKMVKLIIFILFGFLATKIILSNPSNAILIQRFVTINELYGFIGIFIIWTFFFFDFLSGKSLALQFEWFVFCFYLLFLCAGLLTHGEGMRSFLFQDKLDTFMDFFNSIQYNGMPYSNKVIYPPLINVIYDILGRFVILEDVVERAFYIRSSQMGMMIFGIFTIGIILLMANTIYDIRLNGKIRSSVLVLLSAPFIFGFERGNSILLALLFLLLYFKYYNSKHAKEKIISYFALGCAAGIKISPALFGLLLVREKQYKDAILALAIGMALFFLPFLFTDGDIYRLLTNIQYTTDAFRGYIIDDSGNMRSVGTGYYINLSSLFVFLERLFNINIHFMSFALNLLVLIIGIFIAVYVKSIEQWKIAILLGGMIALCPGFSAVYNLLFLIPGVLLFLNNDPENTKMNKLYAGLIFLLMIPMVNFKMPWFSFSYNDLYPARLSTVIESIALLFLVVGLEIEGMIVFFNKEFGGYSRTRKMICSVIGVFGLLSVFGYTINLMNRPVKAFFPLNLSAGAVMHGFELEDGQYKWIGEKASILLETKGVLDDGLFLSFAPERSTLLWERQHEIDVYINQQFLDKKRIDLIERPYIYITPDQLKSMGVEEGGAMEVCIEQLGDSYSRLPVCYMGPAALLSSITSNSYITATTGGVHRRFGDNQLCLGTESNILLDRTAVQDGLLINYRVPAELLELYGDEKLNLEIFVNGILKKTITVDNLLPQVVILQPEDLNGFGDLHKAVELSLKINGGFSDKDFGYSEDERKCGLWLDYIGPCKSPMYIRDVWVDNIITQYFSNEEFKEYGMDVVYRVPPGVLNAGFDRPLEINLVQNGKVIWQKTVSDDKYGGLHIAHISSEYFMGDNRIDKIDLKLLNSELSWEDRGADEKYRRGIFLQWLGQSNISHEVSGDMNEETISPYFMGFYFKDKKRTWQMGKKGTLILPKVNYDVAELYIDYFAEDYLFIANPDISMQLSVIVNGDNVGVMPIERSNRQRICNEALQKALRKNDDGVVVELVANNVYNLAQMNILPKEKDDRSIEISKIGIQEKIE